MDFWPVVIGTKGKLLMESTEISSALHIEWPWPQFSHPQYQSVNRFESIYFFLIRFLYKSYTEWLQWETVVEEVVTANGSESC